MLFSLKWIKSYIQTLIVPRKIFTTWVCKWNNPYLKLKNQTTTIFLWSLLRRKQLYFVKEVSAKLNLWGEIRDQKSIIRSPWNFKQASVCIHKCVYECIIIFPDTWMDESVSSPKSHSGQLQVVQTSTLA